MSACPSAVARTTPIVVRPLPTVRRGTTLRGPPSWSVIRRICVRRPAKPTKILTRKPASAPTSPSPLSSIPPPSARKERVDPHLRLRRGRRVAQAVEDGLDVLARVLGALLGRREAEEAGVAFVRRRGLILGVEAGEDGEGFGGGFDCWVVCALLQALCAYLVWCVQDENPCVCPRELARDVYPRRSLSARNKHTTHCALQALLLTLLPLHSTATHRASKFVRSIHTDKPSPRLCRASASTRCLLPRSSWLHRL